MATNVTIAYQGGTMTLNIEEDATNVMDAVALAARQLNKEMVDPKQLSFIMNGTQVPGDTVVPDNANIAAAGNARLG